MDSSSDPKHEHTERVERPRTIQDVRTLIFSFGRSEDTRTFLVPRRRPTTRSRVVVAAAGRPRLKPRHVVSMAAGFALVAFGAALALAASTVPPATAQQAAAPARGPTPAPAATPAPTVETLALEPIAQPAPALPLAALPLAALADDPPPLAALADAPPRAALASDPPPLAALAADPATRARPRAVERHPRAAHATRPRVAAAPPAAPPKDDFVRVFTEADRP